MSRDDSAFPTIAMTSRRFTTPIACASQSSDYACAVSSNKNVDLCADVCSDYAVRLLHKLILNQLSANAFGTIDIAFDIQY